MPSFFKKPLTKFFAIIFILGGFLFFQILNVLAAHTLDTSQQNSSLTANPATFAYTSGAGTTVLVLNLVVVGSTARTGGAPTYNGVAMTQADGTRIATETNTEMWYLLNPPTGSAYTVSIPNTNTGTIHAFTATAKAQSGYTSALDVVNGATRTTANPSVSVTTTTSGNFVTSIVGHGNGSLTGVTGNKTQYGGVWGIDHGAYTSLRMYELQATAGATTHTYTVGPDDWGMVVAAFKQVPLVTTLADGAAPPSVTVAPESGIIDLDYFTLATNIGNDTVTAVTVTLNPAGAWNNIAQVDLTDNSNVAKCSAVINPTSNIISFTGCTAPVTTSATTYKVRITPKTHALQPSPNTGESYATTGTVTAFTSTNASQVLADTGSATITIDNLSPAPTTGAGTTVGDTQLTVSWTNSTSTDFSNVVVLRDTATIGTGGTPAEGSTPIVGSSCGGTACQVRYISSGTSFVDTGLTNDTTYYYRFFAKDTNGNYTAYASTQQVTGMPTAGNAVPTVTSPTATSISTSTATLGANVTSLGVSAVLSARGICYGLTATPTSCVSSGTTGGIFTQPVTGLTTGTPYYYRGYATNSTGTGYSSDGTFTTLSVPTATLSASSTNVAYNTATTLSWNSTNATGCTATGGTFAGAKATSGSESTGNLTTSTTYTLYCTGAGGNSSTQSVTVTVGSAPSATLTTSTSTCTILSGASTCLIPFTWSISNASTPNLYNTTTINTYSTSASGTNVSYAITNGPNTVQARDSSTVLAQVTATGSCTSGTTWSGTICAAITYTITASSGTGGTVTPSGTTTVAQGASQAYAITPSSGYNIETLLIDGGPVATSTTYTFSDVQGNHTISATFVYIPPPPGSFTIIAYTGANGTVEPSGSTVVTQGNSQTYTITPNAGFEIGSLLIDSFAATTSTSYTFTNVQANHTIEATFVALPGMETPVTAGPILASITFSGKAFPGGKISIVQKELDTETTANQQDISRADGSFNIRFTDLPKGIHSFGLLVKDPDGRTSQTKFFLVDANKTDAVFKDIVVPPTVDMLYGQVSRGSNLNVFGYASPAHTIRIYLDDILSKEALAGRGGAYSFNLPTGALDFGQHKVRAKQINLDGGKESDFSTTRTFIVSKLAVVKADLNGDGKIDIKDWSIFLARWSGKKSAERASIDLNGDGKVDIGDFSIFIKTIKKK